jgi:hypothetical protein
MKLDVDRSAFDSWESKRDSCQRLYLEKQGAYANLDLSRWTCKKCVNTRDNVCAQCSNVKNQTDGAQRGRLLDMVRTLARFIGQVSTADETLQWKEGVRSAAAIVACVSQKFKANGVCHMITEEAQRADKPVWPVLVEDGVPDGWLTKLQNFDLMIPMFRDDAFDGAMAQLIGMLGSSARKSPPGSTTTMLSKLERLVEDESPISTSSRLSGGSSRQSSRMNRIQKTASFKHLTSERSNSMLGTGTARATKASPPQPIKKDNANNGRPKSPLQLNRERKGSLFSDDVSATPERLRTSKPEGTPSRSDSAQNSSMSFSSQLPEVCITSEVMHRMIEAEKASAAMVAAQQEKDASLRVHEQLHRQHEATRQQLQRQHEEFNAQLHLAQAEQRQAEARVMQLAESLAAASREKDAQIELLRQQNAGTVAKANHEAQLQGVTFESELRATRDKLAAAEQHFYVSSAIALLATACLGFRVLRP